MSICYHHIFYFFHNYFLYIKICFKQSLTCLPDISANTSYISTYISNIYK
nr:MAG TPA: hypothetical protein [Bacteriophage sp.]